MALKTILVHLDNTARCEHRLDLAIDLARKHQAHLSGYYANDNPLHALRSNAEGFTAARMQPLFQQKTAQAGITADWLDGNILDPVTTPVVDKLILQAYFADLLIVGQPDTVSGGQGQPTDLPERVAMASGRPVLVIPRRGEFSSLGDRVMVAWRGGRASARALHDAIPLLLKAQHVNLMMVNPLDSFQSEAEKLVAYLAWNSITATWNRIADEELSTGNILLNQACDLGIDLLVVGLLSINRRGKASPGPVGRYLLDFMTIPILMSG
jgi:nucleotide-binding universal stress UspA family protein